MDGFLDLLRSGAVRCEAAGKRALLGVSGGADSVALLVGLNELRDELGLGLVVAHLDHGLRTNSADDAEWVAAVADELGVEGRIGRVDVRAAADGRGIGIEEAARDARYDFLAKTASAAGCDLVAVAHTADDQAETVLHHLLRGTGLPGLRGMPSTRSLANGTPLVRPLLDATRSEVEAFLADRGRTYLEDETNRSTAFTRNRIRTELLPQLERDYNPNVRAALCRLARQAVEVTEIVDDQATRLLDAALVRAGDDVPSPTKTEEASAEAASTEARDPGAVVRLAIASLAAAPDHLVRAALVELWRRRHWPRQRMGFADWQRLVDIARDGGAATLHGKIDARRIRDHLVLRRG